MPRASSDLWRRGDYLGSYETDLGREKGEKSRRHSELHGGATDMIRVNSRVRLNRSQINLLERAQVQALEETAELLHSEVTQAQVFPRDTGALQDESTFVDYSQSSEGKVTIVSSTPYARRLYFHPEYKFQKTANPNAKGKWYEDWLPGGKYANFCAEAFAQIYRRVARL